MDILLEFEFIYITFMLITSKKQRKTTENKSKKEVTGYERDQF